MKEKDLEACRSAFSRWADKAKHTKVLALSPDPRQTRLLRELLPDADIREWHIQHYDLNSGPPTERFDVAFAANTFMCAVDPGQWISNVLSRCGELWIQEPVRAWRDGHRETSPETGDHSRFTFPSRGELSRIPGFDLESSPAAKILDIEFYSDDGANTGEDYKDCRKFVARLAWKGTEVAAPSCVIPATSESTLPIRKPNKKDEKDV
jgi:hypothetical protein